ncbi:hypothetical protein PTKIN_Ptkin09bG0118500 [Pterospermum kingtungense]
MIKLDHRLDDKCTASTIAAYEKENFLDKALGLILQLEKDGFEPGTATYTVLVDGWVHVSLCDMYSRAGLEKKALQALGVLEAKKEELGSDEFERTINALITGGFVQDAWRIRGLMEARGFAPSEQLKIALLASQAFSGKRPAKR